MGGGASKTKKPEQKYEAGSATTPAEGDDKGNKVKALRSKVKAMLNRGESFVITEEALLKGAMDELLENASKVEGTITPFLQDVAAKCNGELVGLNYKFKGRESLERKIKGDIECKKRSLSRGSAAHAAIDIPSIVHAIGDSLRYTMLIPDDQYVATVINTRKVLEQMGYPGLKFKNYWEKGDMYQGINDIYHHTASNFLFELQFHTKASWDLKAESHIIYEKFRVCKDPVEQSKLFQEGVQLALTLNVPEGVENIPKLVRNPAPNILAAYGQLIHENSTRSKDHLKEWITKICGTTPQITVEVDDERTIEAELSDLVDTKNKPVEQVVEQDYYYGVMVKIVIDPKAYVPLVKKIIEAMKTPNPEPSKNIQCAHVLNNWPAGKGAKCVRLLCCLGSKATTFPADNILFEVVIHTPESCEADEDANTIMKKDSNNITESELAEEMNLLWESCVSPDNIHEIVST